MISSRGHSSRARESSDITRVHGPSLKNLLFYVGISVTVKNIPAIWLVDIITIDKLYLHHTSISFRDCGDIPVRDTST